MNLAYDLFLLTFNLSQLHDREKITQLFLEGLHEIFKPAEFAFSEYPIIKGIESFEIKSRKNQYGYILFKENIFLTEEHKVLICNAIQMVAVIIDNLDYGARLEVEKERLHKYADLKLSELKNTVKELEDARSASINLIEDLSEEIEKRKSAEALIRESEVKFRNLFEHSPVGKSMTGVDGTLNVNKSFCTIVGYSEEELYSKHWKEISHPDDIPLTEGIVKTLLEGQSDSARFEKRYLHKNGSIIYTDVLTYLQRDSEGIPQYFITTINDITQRKKIEAESFRLQDIINSSSNEIYIFNSSTLNFNYLNRGAVNNIGYTLEEMRQLTPLDIKPDYTEAEFRKMLKPLLSGKKEKIIFETIHQRKNGTRYPVEIHLQYYNKDNAGLFMAVINDITERKISESALIESEQKYRTLIEVSLDAIFINQNNTITYVNNSGLKLFGAERREQIIGKSPYDIFHPDYHEIINSRISEMLGTETSASLIEEKIVRLDGSVVDVEVAATPFVFRNERAIQVILRDISDRKKAEAEIMKLNEDLEERVALRTIQLKSANKELEAFSYSVSHDLRAPLRAIHSFTNILREDYKDTLDDEGKRICGVIEASSVHMGQLIDDLLAFSRIGRSEIQYSKIDMNRLVKSVSDELLGSQINNNLKLKIGKIPAAYGDSSALRQVYINLISNALKYSSRNEIPEISIGCELINSNNVFYVRDNGVGFDMKYADKLFRVFQRLHSTKEFEGNGVGLAIVHRIISKHGGSVWAEGEVGNGATFYFTLPETKNSHL